MATSVRTVDSGRDLGVAVDSHLTMTTHVSAVCRAAYYQLRQLRPLIRSLSSDAAKFLVQAFISACLDYYNSLLYGISDNLYRRIQVHRNAAARLITNRRRCKHFTPSCNSCVGFQCANVCNSRSPCWCTRHCTTTFLRIWLGDRSFDAAGPRVWNSLPTQLRETDITL